MIEGSLHWVGQHTKAQRTYRGQRLRDECAPDQAVRAEHVRLRLLGRGPDPMDVSGIFYNKPENRPKEEDGSNYIGGLFSSLKGNPKKSKGNSSEI